MKNIILMGMKGCGKSTVGRLLAKKLNTDFLDSDKVMEKLHAQKKKTVMSVRDIFKKYGQHYFESLDTAALKGIKKNYQGKQYVLACSGRTPLNEKNQKMLKKMG